MRKVFQGFTRFSSEAIDKQEQSETGKQTVRRADLQINRQKDEQTGIRKFFLYSMTTLKVKTENA